MRSAYDRKKYIPTVEIPVSESAVETDFFLDHLAADYNGIFENLKSFTDFQVSFDYEARLDKIAYLFYKRTDLWWVIGYYNGIVNPVFDLPIGKWLRIPNKQDVEFRLQINKKVTQVPRRLGIR